MAYTSRGCSHNSDELHGSAIVLTLTSNKIKTRAKPGHMKYPSVARLRNERLKTLSNARARMYQGTGKKKSRDIPWEGDPCWRGGKVVLNGCDINFIFYPQIVSQKYNKLTGMGGL